MTLAIVGTGLVTPSGNRPSEHAFFLRAGVPAPAPSPFLDAEGERIDVRYCRELGARMPVAERLRALGLRALEQARAAFSERWDRDRVRIFVCLPSAREGLRPEDGDLLVAALGSSGSVERCYGDAGVFAAIRGAEPLLANGELAAVAIVAVDSFVSIEAVTVATARTATRWEIKNIPAPSEGGAALVLMTPYVARREQAPILGSFMGAATSTGKSNDDNDEPVDGAAMSVALRELPSSPKVLSAFGPWKVDTLRHDEWATAAARLRSRFDSESDFVCLESRVGRLGAASGLANLVYGLAVHTHAIGERAESASAPFFAWAISSDGTRGVALASTRLP